MEKIVCACARSRHVFGRTGCLTVVAFAVNRSHFIGFERACASAETVIVIGGGEVIRDKVRQYRVHIICQLVEGLMVRACSYWLTGEHTVISMHRLNKNIRNSV